MEVKNYCANCKKPVSDKARYCSDKCRMAYTRRTKKGELPEQNDPEHIEIPTRTGLTRTDREFEEYKPGYYNFTDKVETRKCVMCEKDFKTSLPLLKVCSRKCQINLLKGLSGRASEAR